MAKQVVFFKKLWTFVWSYELLYEAMSFCMKLWTFAWSYVANEPNETAYAMKQQKLINLTLMKQTKLPLKTESGQPMTQSNDEPRVPDICLIIEHQNFGNEQ